MEKDAHEATDLAERIVTEARESHGRVKPGHAMSGACV
jgi:hypothetical protein